MYCDCLINSHFTEALMALFPMHFCELDYTLSVKKSVFLRFLGVLDVIPTRRVKSISKLFCIEDLIRRGFI